MVAGSFLLLVGAGGLVLGFHDTFNAEDPQSRLLGFVILLASALLVVGFVVAFWLDRPWARRYTAVASIVAASIGVSFLVARARSGDSSTLTFLWVAILIGGLLSFVLVFRPREWRKLSTKEVLSGVAPVVSVGTLLTAAQFYYNAFYVPQQKAPALTVSVDLEPAGSDGDMAVLTGTVRAVNATDTRVRILGSLYTVSGTRLADRPARERGFADELPRPAITPEAAPSSASRVARRYSDERQIESIQADDIVGDNFVFEPSEEVTRRFVAQVPRREVDLVRLNAEFIVARASRLKLEGNVNYPFGRRLVNFQDPRGTEGIVSTQAIEETSWVRDLTRGDRLMKSVWVVRQERPAKSTVFPLLAASIDRENRIPEDPKQDFYLERLAEFYGVASTATSTELILSSSSR